MTRRPKLRNWKQALPTTIAVESRTLVTLLDLGDLVAALPKARRDLPCWIAVANAVMAAAEGGSVGMAIEHFRGLPA
jgi:hypothetical protein